VAPILKPLDHEQRLFQSVIIYPRESGAKKSFRRRPSPDFRKTRVSDYDIFGISIQGRVDIAAVERVFRALNDLRRSIPLKPRRRDVRLGAFLIDARRAATAPGERIATHTTGERGGQPLFRRFCPRPMFLANADRAAA
jgi:hypothetical protein